MPTPATAERIQREALRLFSSRGFDSVTVEEVAAAAGVSHMTFFRHFPTKEAVVLTDPWDPMIAAAVAAEDPALTSLERVRRGFLAAVEQMGSALDDDTHLRVKLVSGHPRLRAKMWETNQVTADAIVDALTATGAERFEATVATSACLGALMAALLDWGTRAPVDDLGSRIRTALGLLEGLS